MPTAAGPARAEESPAVPVLLAFVVPFMLGGANLFLSVYFPLVTTSLLALVGITVGGALAFPLGLVSILRFRRGAMSLSRVLWICGGLALTGPLTGTALLWSANCLADRSPPASYTAKVVHCEMHEDTTATSGNVILRWEQGWTRLGVSDCDLFYDGSKALVTTRAGALGFTWITEVEGGKCWRDSAGVKSCKPME